MLTELERKRVTAIHYNANEGFVHLEETRFLLELVDSLVDELEDRDVYVQRLLERRWADMSNRKREE